MSKLFLHKNEGGSESELVKKFFSLLELTEPKTLFKSIIEQCNPKLSFLNNVCWEDTIYATEIVDEFGRIDIFIYTKNTVFGIEVKYNAGLGSDQDIRYEKKIKRIDKEYKALIVLTRHSVNLNVKSKEVDITKLRWHQISRVIKKYDWFNDYTSQKLKETFCDLLDDFELHYLEYQLPSLDDGFYRFIEAFKQIKKHSANLIEGKNRNYSDLRTGKLKELGELLTPETKAEIKFLCNNIYSIIDGNDELEVHEPHRASYNSFLFKSRKNNISYFGRYYKSNSGFLLSKSVIFDLTIHNQVRPFVMITVEKDLTTEDTKYTDNNGLYDIYDSNRNKSNVFVFDKISNGNHYQGIAKVIKIEEYEPDKVIAIIDELTKKMLQHDGF